MGPKHYTRIARIDQAFRLKERQPDLDWLGVAVQLLRLPSLVRGFKAFTGVTPPQLLAAAATHKHLVASSR